jgi:enoyl-CoA hydratase/carnithine racemase
MAVVRGRCFGAGCEWTLLCHEVWADRTAKFAFPEMAIGAFATVAPLLLPDRVGRTRALDLLLSGREVDAAEACRN